MCCSGDGKRCKKTVEKIGGVFCTQKQTLTVAELLQRNEEYPLVDVEKETFSPPPAWMTDDLLIISDTHFFEKDRNVYPRRVPGWKKLIIQNWNKAVRDCQVILHLGDLYYGNKKYGQELLGALKGCKRLLLGNHDKKIPLPVLRSHGCFDEIFEKPFLCFEYRGMKLVFSHFPCILSEPGVYNIHGHVHDYAHDCIDDQHFNVSVENTSYAPIRLGDIIQIIRQREGITKGG